MPTKSMSNADKAVSLRLTAGEKAVLGTLAASGVLTLPIVAITGINVAERRHFEKKARSES
jgi:hypothetical protein